MSDSVAPASSKSGRAGRGTLLVVAAVEEEIHAARRFLDIGVGGLPVRFLATGVGKASAAFAVGRELQIAMPDLCVHVGCAGAFESSGLALGDVVVASADCLGDEGFDGPEGFQDLADLRFPLHESGTTRIYNEIPLWSPSPETLDRVRSHAGNRFRVRSGRLVTVSSVTGTSARAKFLTRRWQAVAESMEGAAVGLACLRSGCPCLEVRGISNEVGNRDRSTWEIELAVLNAAEVARWIVEAGTFE